MESDSVVAVTGAIEGSANVDAGAILIIERGGKLAGSLWNDGLVILRGVFDGYRDGAGGFRIEEHGRIK